MGNIAVTGIGVVSAAGLGTLCMWKTLRESTDLFEPISRCPSLEGSGIKTADIGENAIMWMKAANENRFKPNDFYTLLLYNACLQALYSGYVDEPHGKIGLSIGTTTAGWEATERLFRKGSIAFPNNVLNTSAIISVAGALKLEGPQYIVSSACASSIQSISLAIQALENNEADIMVAGGIDVLVEYPPLGFNSLRLLGPEPCKPFDVNRRYITLGEGAGFVVLEKKESATKRLARIRGYVQGIGESCDAKSMATPDKDGIKRAIEEALYESKLSPDDIDLVIAHATGTQSNDLAEHDGIVEGLYCKKSLSHYRQVPVTAIKGVFGHTQGAAGIFNVIAGLLMMENSCITPIARCEIVDPKLKLLHLITERLEHHPIRSFMANAFGFGGDNAVIVVTRDEV